MTKTELLRAFMAAAPDAEVDVVAETSGVCVRIDHVEIVADGHRPWRGPVKDMIMLVPSVPLETTGITFPTAEPSESKT